MALSATLLARMQRKLAISNDQTVFTDAALNDIYDEAAENFDLAMAIALREILMNAAKFIKYSVGQTTMNKDQMFDHLKDMYAEYKAVAVGNNQFKIVGINRIPPRRKDRPEELLPNLSTLMRPTSSGHWVNNSPAEDEF